MPYTDREQKLAYDREYRRTHRDQANAANARYRASALGIMNEHWNYVERRATRALERDHGTTV